MSDEEVAKKRVEREKRRAVLEAAKLVVAADPGLLKSPVIGAGGKRKPKDKPKHKPSAKKTKPATATVTIATDDESSEDESEEDDDTASVGSGTSRHSRVSRGRFVIPRVIQKLSDRLPR